MDAALELLSQRELVRPAFPFIAGQRAFRFGHALVRDAAYAAMPLAARADAHERLAAWLADLGAAVPEASARIGTAARARLARRERAAPARRAARALAHSAGGTARRGRARGARARRPAVEIAFLERALALLAPGDGARAELLPAMGVALFEAGSLDRGRAVADEAVPPVATASACAARSSASACAPTGTPSPWTRARRSSSPSTPPRRSRRWATTSASHGRAT